MLSWSQALETSVKQDKQKKEPEERLCKSKFTPLHPNSKHWFMTSFKVPEKPLMREALSLVRNTNLYYYYYETHLEFLLPVGWVRNKSTLALSVQFFLLFRFHFKQNGQNVEFWT